MSAGCRLYEQDALHAITGPAIRPGGLALTEYALDQCSLAPTARVLDVGCGSAATLEHLIDTRRVHAMGLDPSRKLLLAGRQRRQGLPVIQAQGEALPYPDALFDVLLAECCFSLIAERERALAEFARVLRAGGRLILSDIYARNAQEIPAAGSSPLASCVTQALSREWLQTRLLHHNLRISLWEDHTVSLKSLVGQIIFAHGSLEQFWRALWGQSLDACALTRTTERLKPGYFLLLAQKDAS